MSREGQRNKRLHTLEVLGGWEVGVEGCLGPQNDRKWTIQGALRWKKSKEQRLETYAKSKRCIVKKSSWISESLKGNEVVLQQKGVCESLRDILLMFCLGEGENVRSARLYKCDD